MYDYFEVLHEISQWKKELERLRNEEPQDAELIEEAKGIIRNYQAILEDVHHHPA